MGKAVTKRQPVTLGKTYPVVGLSGQSLGYISRMVVDLECGTVVSCEIETDWQRMELGWDCLTFNAGHELFNIRKARD